MTLENYACTVLNQLASAQNYPQVDVIITDSIVQISNKDHISQHLKLLVKKIENLSPLVLSSTQFSCFRYALVNLRHYDVLHQD